MPPATFSVRCTVGSAGSSDILLVTDLSLPGVRDAMRLQQLAHDVAPGARLHLAVGGVIDARRSAVKVADVERTLKRKVNCQVPADISAVLAAVNFGKPLSEAAPKSAIVKALKPFVAGLDHETKQGNRPGATSMFGRIARALGERRGTK
jgi:pilus assembly protein CpaE